MPIGVTNNGVFSGRVILDKPGRYILLEDIMATVFVACDNVELDMDSYSVLPPNGQRGVVLFQSWEDRSVKINNARQPRNFKIYGGSIVTVDAECIYGSDALGCQIDDMDLRTTNGKDLAAVYFKSGDYSLCDSYVNCKLTQIINRHQGPAAIKSDKSATQITRCFIEGGNSAINIGDGSVVQDCLLMHDGKATNGYALFTWAHENNSTPRGRLNSGSVAGKDRGVVFTGNTALPRDGRGVILNGWNNALVADNTILSWEKPNKEFGDNLNAPAIRIRYQTDNITVRNNTTLGVAGGDWCAASSIYMTTADKSKSLISDNLFMTCLVGTPSLRKYAQPLAFEGSYGDDKLNNNICLSNHHFMHLEGYDGPSIVPSPIEKCNFAAADGSTMFNRFLASIRLKIPRRFRQLATNTVDDFMRELSSKIIREKVSDDLAFIRTDFFTHDKITSATLLDCTWNGVDQFSTTLKYSAPRSGGMEVSFTSPRFTEYRVEKLRQEIPAGSKTQRII
jgi:hypothetical protein